LLQQKIETIDNNNNIDDDDPPADETAKQRYICFVEPAVADPYIVPIICKHVFLFDVLTEMATTCTASIQVQTLPSNTYACAACRADTPDVDRVIADRAFNYRKRAARDEFI
jgi:hypothetical protein